ncbi:CinA family nicotinamide mononucleotide deamidase-related protein [Flavobacterium sp. NRK1]|uniref:CinA family nicotinamide mononucleotide deamidase-related protein n=1 Tax=Flavobacterium sp. NRK1 TaxID=2954929 RepID=UPI0020938B99|nr:CinA family nicotinamide mononucleotide deamidase-related protein [Flavobacterium sp. NRK1]MCO6146714.1 CinA family nicotinamide mononucleotide deamidase-related protein [Flavobacterium sp. NRK1]
MKAAVVTIGDEILIGQITDTNSGYIAKALDKIGIGVYETRSISDERHHIMDTLSYFQNRVDVVVVTGGLGPTKDDVTKMAFCEYFDDYLVRNEEVETHVIALIERAMNRPASQINKDQALVPSKAKILHNAVGTAPGMLMKRADTIYISLPGVPYEMKYLVDNEIIPFLIERFERPYIIHKTIITHGQGESLVAERIEDWENNLPDFIKLAYLPNPGRVRLRLSARGTDEAFLQNSINTEVEKLKVLIGDIIIGFDEGDTIEVVLGRILKQKGKTIALAESCTGGKIAQMITSVAGSSAYFKGSAVTYATEAKVNVLKIEQQLIDVFSVVSAQVAENMALKARQLFNADYAVSTTGNAGPLKGDSAVEVGTVFIGIATAKGVYSEKLDLGQPREKVIERAANKALEKIYQEILKN